MVTGLDDPRLYATSDGAGRPELRRHRGRRRRGQGRPIDTGPAWVSSRCRRPAPGSPSTRRARWSTSSVSPRTDRRSRTGWTVYVVEPHGNAVYADARLPEGLTPAAWCSDVKPEYPSADRQQLLVFDGTGTMASIDAGSHAFAWRLPGVIAGALTAGLLYLLTRILFRRRLVAGLVGLFVLADGMFFVQSRIGMNDVYVGLFIIAAYTVFAAVWTGWWGAGRVLAGDAGHRRAARAGPRQQVGRRLRDRGAAAADPRAQRARPGRGDPRADRRSPSVLGYMAISVPAAKAAIRASAT